MDSLQRQERGYDETTPVLIVGGSLVGLSTALFLSWHGIRCLLVERHAGISPHPRAFNFNIRTMELFHKVGAEEAIRQKAPPNFQNSGILQAESLAGQEFGWITQDTTASMLSNIPGCIIGQDALEPVLRERAEKLGADLRFSTEFVSFEQDAEGISAIIRDRASGEERSVHARYLIAADGNRSTIRQQLGIKTYGPGSLGSQLSILFSADMQIPLRGRRLVMCFVNNPEVRRGTALVFARNGQNFALFTPYAPQKGEREEDFAGEYGIKLVRGAIGMPDLPIEIINVRPWEVAAWAAATFQQGNVFLAGDSAHVNPPAGAFGANTGIADAYNLAWKMALVMQNVAPATLLSTYTEERQPVARYTVEQAFSLFTRYTSGPAQKDTRPVVPYNAVAFGYRYHSTALSNSSDKSEWYEDPDHPTGCVGTHAAYVVLEKHGKQCSTLDLFGKHIVLLTGADGAPWCETARSVTERLGISLDIYSIGRDLIDIHGRFLAAYGIQSGGAVLVRPDGFIGWRAEGTNTHPIDALEDGLVQLLMLDQRTLREHLPLSA